MKYPQFLVLLFLSAIFFIACPTTQAPVIPPTNPVTCTSCISPTGLQANDIQDITIKVAWNIVPTADFYRLKLVDTNGVVLSKVNVPKDTTQYRFNGLNTETTYIIRLLSYCHAGTDTCFSDSISIQARTIAGGGGHVVVIEDNIDVFAGACAPSSTLSEGNGLSLIRKDACVQLAWSPPKDVRNYIIAYRPINTIINSNATDCANLSASNKWFCRLMGMGTGKAQSCNYHLIGLCPSTSYQVKVLAYPTSNSCLNFANVNQWNCSSFCN